MIKSNRQSIFYGNIGTVINNERHERYSVFILVLPRVYNWLYANYVDSFITTCIKNVFDCLHVPRNPIRIFRQLGVV